MAMQALARPQLRQLSSRPSMTRPVGRSRLHVNAFFFQQAFGGNEAVKNTDIDAQVKLMQDRLKERRSGNAATMAMTEKSRRLKEKERQNLERQKRYLAAEKMAAEGQAAQEQALKERMAIFGPGGKGVSPVFR